MVALINANPTTVPFHTLFPLTPTDAQILLQAENHLQGLSPASAADHLQMWAHMNTVVERTPTRPIEPLDAAQFRMLERAVYSAATLPATTLNGLLSWLRTACMLTAD